MSDYKDLVLETFIKAMESNLSDSEKRKILDDLYETMDIFNGVLDK